VQQVTLQCFVQCGNLHSDLRCNETIFPPASPSPHQIEGTSLSIVRPRSPAIPMLASGLEGQMEEPRVVGYQGRFVWYELVTTDVAAAKTFYTRVMGWAARDASTPNLAYTFFTVGNTSASGLMGLPEDAVKTGTTPRWIGYVAVDDVDATVDRLRRLGGAVHVPPTNLLNLSRFSVVADPQMASFALIKWLKPRSQTPGESDEPGRVGWHELLAADCRTAFDFYGQLFDWQKMDADIGPAGPYHLFAIRGQTIGGMYTKHPLVPVPLWLYYFNVRDINAAAERVKEGGGQVFEGLVEVPGGNWIARCADPQGAMFALEGKRKHSIGYFAPISSPALKPKRS
jgi:predicted enzyme related to lactoylglutathione lyase